jgi:hypothetical protein
MAQARSTAITQPWTTSNATVAFVTSDKPEEHSCTFLCAEPGDKVTQETQCLSKMKVHHNALHTFLPLKSEAILCTRFFEAMPIEFVCGSILADSVGSHER